MIFNITCDSTYIQTHRAIEASTRRYTLSYVDRYVHHTHVMFVDSLRPSGTYKRQRTGSENVRQ